MLLALLTLLLTACVGVIKKETPLEKSIINSELNQSIESSQLTSTQLTSDWWRAYGDKQLDMIIEKALNESPHIKSIQAKYALKNSQVDFESSKNLPSISANAGYTKERFSENYIFPPPMGGSTYSLYQTGLTLDYSFDFWDARASRIASAKYIALAQKATLDATKLRLATALCAIYLSWNYDEKSLTLLLESKETLLQKREILQNNYRVGVIDALALYSSTQEIATQSESIEALKRSIESKREALSILGGFLPSFTESLKAPKIANDFRVPLPKEIYLNLLSHRADISIEKYILLSKSKRIEGAKAEFYPNISLLGVLSFVSFDFEKFFTSSSYAPALGGALSLPLFDGGAREANLQTTLSDYHSALHDYNGAIIKAANEVVGVLKREKLLKSQILLHKEALHAIESSEIVADKRYKGGLTNKLPYLQAQLEHHRGELDAIALNAERASLQIELIQALGGGYIEESDNAKY